MAAAFMDGRLYRAARSGNICLLRQLADEDSHLLLQSTPRKNTALHIAARYGRKEFVIDMCNRCPQLVSVPNSKGDTVLHVVSRAGYFHIADFLIDWIKISNGFSPPDGVVENGRTGLNDMLRMGNGKMDTPLHEAARNGHGRLGILLMKEDPELACLVNEEREDVLFLAAKKGCLDVVEYILLELKITSINQGPDGLSPLHVAVVYGHFDIFKRLVESNSDLVKLKDIHGNSPIHYATYFGDLPMLQKLLNLNTSLVYVQDNNGQSSIHMASKCGHVNVIKELIREFPDSVELIDKRGRSALHVAIESEKTNVVSFMLSSIEFDELINEADNDGNTPLHLATMHNHLPIINMFLADNRVNVRALNKDSLTALDIALSNSNSSMKFQKLLITRALILARASQTWWAKKMRHDTQKASQGGAPVNKSFRNIANAILAMSAFVASVTFTAAFTMPGGYNNNGPHQGLATLSTTFFFKAFIISDMVALICSIIVAWLLIRAYMGGEQFLTIGAISFALQLMDIALLMLVVAFTAGACSVLSGWIAFVVLICFELFLVFLAVSVFKFFQNLSHYFHKMASIYQLSQRKIKGKNV